MAAIRAMLEPEMAARALPRAHFALIDRLAAINALNHPQFTAPNTSPATTAFGVVTGEFAWPRVIQFGMKVLF